MITPIWDGTAPGAEQHVNGPGLPGLEHEYPEGSRTSLCGSLRSDDHPGETRKCQACAALVGHRAWYARDAISGLRDWAA